MKKKFIENFFSLTVLRVLTLIVPLVTYPYLIRVLGSNQYGLVMWAWSIVNFFILFINFGFNLSVTKYISIHRDNKEKVSEIVSTTLITKTLLFFASFIIFLILVNSVPKMVENKELFFYTFALTLGETMMPIWYFQGIEKMKYTAMITSFVKLAFTVLVFIMIKETSDFLKVPALYAIASLLSALFAYYLIFFKHKIHFIKPRKSEILFYIKDSVTLFLSSSISVIKDSITIIFIEKYIGLSGVAYFDIAQKFVNILLTPFHILASVLFPHLSKTRDLKLLKQAMFYSTFIALSFYGMSYVFDKQIVQVLMGKESLVAEELIRILAFSIIFANLASLLGTNGLVIIGKNKELFLSSLYGVIVYLILLAILSIFIKISLVHIAFCIIFGYFVDVLFRSYYLKGLLWKK